MRWVGCAVSVRVSSVVGRGMVFPAVRHFVLRISGTEGRSSNVDLDLGYGSSRLNINSAAVRLQVEMASRHLWIRCDLFHRQVHMGYANGEQGSLNY